MFYPYEKIDNNQKPFEYDEFQPLMLLAKCECNYIYFILFLHWKIAMAGWLAG